MVMSEMEFVLNVNVDLPLLEGFIGGLYFLGMNPGRRSLRRR
jgi:hypothetical protein